MKRTLIRLAAATALLVPFAFAQAQSQTTPATTPAGSAQTTQTAPAVTAPRPPSHRKPQTWTPGSPTTPPADAANQSQDASAPEFDHIALHVRDLAKSADFYQRVLGLVQIPDPFNDAQHIFLRLGARSQLHLVSDAPDAPKSAATTKPASAARDIHEHFALHVASVPDFAARLDRMKVPYRGLRNEPQKMTKRPDGVSQIYFQDPDGYWIEVNDAKY